MQDSLLDAANKFKIGQWVFMYVEPQNSTCPESSPVWQCEVNAIKATRKLVISSHKEKNKDEIEIQLTVSFGFDTRTSPVGNFFTDLEEAKEYAIKQLEKIKQNRIKNREKSDEELSSALSSLKEQTVEDY
jgi:hypothetical protein